MKKTIVMLAAVCACLCCLGACRPEHVTKTPQNQYDALNSMLRASYSRIELTVTDTFDEHTSLKSEYTIQYSESGITVSYTAERFSAIDTALDGPLADVKKTLTGEVVFRDGAVVSQSGDDIDLTADIAETGLTFKEEYFENAQLSGIYLRADVKDPSAFLGSPIVCNNMIVDASFLEVFYEIRIEYESEDRHKTEYQYTFVI